MNTIAIVGLFLVQSILCLYVGYVGGQQETYREAHKNGLMVIERVGQRYAYRWIETHKLGYE